MSLSLVTSSAAPCVCATYPSFILITLVRLLFLVGSESGASFHGQPFHRIACGHSSRRNHPTGVYSGQRIPPYWPVLGLFPARETRFSHCGRCAGGPSFQAFYGRAPQVDLGTDEANGGCASFGTD